MDKLTTQPYILNGVVMHSRTIPKKNTFNYHSYYFILPVSNLYTLKYKLFSINKFNLFSLKTKCYGTKDKPFNAKIIELCNHNQVPPIKHFLLVTQPKMLGYAFNPVSFWICIDHNNNFIAVICEVNNTFKQRHFYLCKKGNFEPISPSDWLQIDKTFYVSPFFETKGYYCFQFEINDHYLNFKINYYINERLMLSTYLKGTLHSFSDKELLLNAIKTLGLGAYKTDNINLLSRT